MAKVNWIRTPVSLDSPSPRGTLQCTPSQTQLSISSDLCANNTDLSDGGAGFTETIRRRKRRNRQQSSGGDNTTTFNKAVTAAALPVLFYPGDAVALSSVSRVKLSAFIGSFTSGLISEIRVNQRKNVIGVGAANPESCATLLQQAFLCGVLVRVYMPPSINSLAGVARDVYHDEFVNEVTRLIRADTEVLNVRGLDGSKTIPIISTGNKLPTQVKI